MRASDSARMRSRMANEEAPGSAAPDRGTSASAEQDAARSPHPVTVVPLCTRQGLVLEMLNGRRGSFKYVEMADAPARSQLAVVEASSVDDDHPVLNSFAVVVVWDRLRQLLPDQIADLLATRADAYVAGPDPEILEAHLAAFCRRMK